MCGILGSVNFPFNNSILDLISHRGPDDFGMEQFVVNENKIQLAQRRLSIIDLSPAGHQPMLSDCGNYAIIFNGEIYNHQELKEKISNNITFKGHSDTETILYFLKEYGITGIKEFNGIFSLAFLDKINKRLFLARDPFGVKPLYYHQGDNNRVVFSSEIRPIKAMLESNTLDKNALATLLRLRYNPSPDTLYCQIKKIKPGHYCKISLGDSPVVEHHAYLSEIPRTVNYSIDKALNLYGQKLAEAIKRQLLSDVEVGVLLSGGIDSALVASLAQKNYVGRLKAFTIGFEGEHAEDEIEDAAETAEILGLEHHHKKISFTDFLTTIKECTRIVEEPLATTSMIPMYFLAELASKQVKVVLTGQGADEPLGGYTRYKLELLRNKIPGFARGAVLPLTKLGNIKKESILRGANAIGIKNEIERFISVYEVFSVYEIEKLIGTTENNSSQIITYLYDLLNCAGKNSSTERMMALDSRLNLSDDLLNYTDKITMNFSMECRVPILDLELVKFVESLPLHLKLNLRSGKIIHKKFAQSILPDKIINRKKKAFQSPTNKWFKTEVDAIKEILLNKNTYFAELFNQSYIAEIIKQHQQGYNKEKQIFLLLTIYYWLCEVSEKPKFITLTGN